MIVDSHCHISGKRFDKDRDLVIARAQEAGLVAMIDVGCDLESCRASLALAEAEPCVWAAVGVHPHEAKDWDEDTRSALITMSASPKVLALGEMGLDFHYDHSPRETQRAVFRAQLALAVELDLPAVLHVREAYEEALDILDELADPKLRGVAHCFTGNATQARGFVERGFGVSFTGVVTFKKAQEIQDAAQIVPRELLLVETDCPYMSPVPLRGKRCEPSFVVHTIKALAALRGEDPQDLARVCAENAARIFAFPLPG